MFAITPELQLRTLFELDPYGRILRTREPCGTRGPLFTLIRGDAACAWATRADVPDAAAAELARLASEEPWDMRAPPLHARDYLTLLGGEVRAGPAFVFPPRIPDPGDVVPIAEETLLGRHFDGWNKGEIAGGRAPLMAVLHAAVPVSICFCARRTHDAAEAGVETAFAFRGRGYAPRAVAAWALEVRASGSVPLYSTSWDNAASLSVAQKLGLVRYAVDWSVVD